jgi:choline kinase
LAGYQVDFYLSTYKPIGCLWFQHKLKLSGELVGIVKLSPKLFACMQRHAKEQFVHSLFYDYETDALVAAAKEIDIDCLVLEDLVWTEIDDEVHLKRAKDEIYPMIKLREQKY